VWDLLAICVPVIVLVGVVVIIRRAMRSSTWHGTAIGSLFLVAWLVVSSVPIFLFDGTYIAFASAYARCGHEPVIAEGILTEKWYLAPGTPGYRPEVNIWGSTTYYCTTRDAEAHGFSKLSR